MKAFINHLFFNLKSGIRDRSLLLMNYLFPIAFYLLIGGIMPKLNPSYGENLIPSMMIFVIIVSTLLGMPNGIVISRNDGIFRSYKINGVPKLSIISIPTISTAIHSIIVTIFIVIIAPILFNVEINFNPLSIIVVFICMYVACSGLALIIGTIADNTSLVVLLAQLIFLPSMLIGGLMLPTSNLPSSLAKAGRLLPTSYAMDLFEALNETGNASFGSGISIAILLLSGLISYVLAIYLYRSDSNYRSKKLFLGLLSMMPFLVGMLVL
ncbi:ABC-2 type transporter family protein [Clostridium argentinense CDC 2741]|uniref:ABC-2 type transporter family protein n=1 Tax=Clostridium argentinense CDC 2741 TaxID=1418104 RepID=A0A0C1QZU3_9CLOT|nr:ABC transporter permease [Clostridium argentinense]ARC86487.1 hypothetical protein RSJ17_19320 [Clostridium argentinense]KIE46642.1 ABC-2 type transporter family protein [Clostridium argentinense CDC 2741]NFF37948.1 ABC transporter permease [Clostridium argentinense]NFP49820.1 ABC transporter permease [Clostridium argentinense]NFP71340.1 ABC transporter permease [Clostridium argentinense]